MMGDPCSWAGCHAEVVAWIDGGAWCGGHALRLLGGERPLPEEGPSQLAVLLQHPGTRGGMNLLRTLLRFPRRFRGPHGFDLDVARVDCEQTLAAPIPSPHA